MGLRQKGLHGRERCRMLAILLSLVLSAALVGAPLVTASAIPVTGGLALGGAGLTFGDFVGSNSFFDENQACYDMLGNVREYHPWHLTEWATGMYTDGGGGYNDSIRGPSPQATFRDSWGAFDHYYRNMHEKDIEVTLVMLGDAYGNWGRPDHQDPNGSNSTVPASYLGHAQSMFQHAARYGSNKNIDPSLVRVAGGTEKQIGLGYIKYYENYNEPANGNFSGAQYAAMLSADYDGHMGTLGPGVGVKAADPNAKVVFGGSWVGWFSHVSNGKFTFDWLADMMIWFDNNRTLEQWKAAHGGSEAGYVKYPFDVVSAHWYCWDAGGNGVSAEAFNTYGTLKAFVENCRTMFPDKEIYLSEFGWDTSPNSSIRASTPGNTIQEIQGRWLVRDYLLAAAAGIDRARQFMMPDASNDRNNSDWHGTSGLINGIQGSSDFKPSWYYIGTMRSVLKDASLDDVEVLADGGWAISGGSVETNGPWALRFNSTRNTDRIYALWLPTSLGDQNGANTQSYTITIPARYGYATLVTLKDGVKWGEHNDISGQIQSGSLTVSISEKPVFVVLSENPYEPPAVIDFIDPINFSAWTLTPNSGDPNKLFDERRTNIEKNPMPNMANSWDPGGINRYAAVDLGAKYDLSGVYVWDRDGALAAGKVLAVYAYTGSGQPTLTPNSMTGAQARTMLSGSDWTRIAWYDFSSWESWVEAIVNVETRYLVLGFEDGPSTSSLPWPMDWLPVPEMVLKGAPASPVVNARTPSIGSQPVDAEYVRNATASPLNVTVSSSGGGTLSYQWYSNTVKNNTTGTIITGAATPSYTPPTTALGTTYFYVVVTNTITDNGDGGTKTASVRSNPAEVRVVSTLTPYDIAFSVNGVAVNGITATGAVSPASPQTAGMPITVTITLTGIAVAAGTHTVRLISTKLGTGITSPASVTKTVAAGEAMGAGDTYIFTFTMPAAAVNDLAVIHNFSPTQPPALAFTHSAAFHIPSSTVGVPIANINVSGGVSGGIPPYRFSATGLPVGISVNSAGVISGAPAIAGAAGTAIITVTDSAAAPGTRSITITYGAISAAPTITGPSSMTLTAGYAATSTGTYTVTGTPAPAVTKISGNAAITWNSGANRLDITAGLAAGSYPVILEASNGVGAPARITFTLTIQPGIGSGKGEGGSGGDPVTYTVVFNANGGSAVPSQNIVQGGKAVKPADPVKNGFDFADWYSDAALTNAYSFSTSVTRSFTLYAKWMERSTGPFKDVSKDAWYSDAVLDMYGRGLMIGVAGDEFDPGGALTRGMIVMILYRLAGEPGVAGLPNPFSDVAAGAWYTDAVVWAVSEGLALGYGDNRFGPNDPVTKEQLAVILYRLQQAKGKVLRDILMDFEWADWDEISDWAKSAVNVLTIQGIFSDIPGSNFNPQAPATRAEVASILYRYLAAAEE